MQKIELKIDDNTIIINTEDNNISVEILDKAGNSLGQNDYKIVEEEDTTNGENTDVDVPEENAIIEDPMLPMDATSEKISFPSFKDFVKNNK